MNGRLQGFLDIIDLLAEGDRRRAELIAGRGFEPELQPVTAPAKVIKFPLTGHQKARLFHEGRAPRVTPRH